MNADFTSHFWQKVSENEFETISLPDVQKPSDRILDCSLPQYGSIRNARIAFKIHILGNTQAFHAAVLFRKNDSKYLGAGLGGWSSYCSLFNRTLGGFVRLPLGDEGAIEKNVVHEFELEFRSGFVTAFKKNAEVIFPFNRLSLRDSLASTMRFGSIGLYAYDKTLARISLDVHKLSTRCFVVTNIEGHHGTQTDGRRKLFADLLMKAGISDVEFFDSRELSREQPLMSKIHGAISESDLVVVDFGCGKPRPNVYYETGIAHSLKTPTVHVGPKEEEFHSYVPSDFKAQFFVLEHELEKELPRTIDTILKVPAGNFDYIG